MKKGFTLIELLSVIAILAVILLIAVPKIIDVVNTSRIQAYISDEKMMIKATETYLTSNMDLLPIDIGDTIEVSLTDLKDNNYISDINDQDGECNGYILVTKLEEGYSYNPQLKCGDSNTIGSSSEDGLITYYNFDDFAEPIVNLVPINRIVGHGSSWVITGELFENEPVYKNLVTTPNVYNNFGFTCQDDIILNPSGSKFITLAFYVKLIVSPGTMYGYVRVRYTDGTYISHQWSYNPSNWSTNIIEEWQKVTATIALSQQKIPENIDCWYVYKDNASQGEMDISKVQIEQRSFATEYVLDKKDGLIIDKAQNNHIVLDNNSAPLWNNEGYYDFKSDQKLIFPFQMNNTNYGLSDAEYTFSMWLKLRKHNNQGMGVIMGMAYYNGFGILLLSDGLTYTKIGGYFRNSTKSTYLYGATIILDSWINIVVAMDKTDGELFVYHNGEKLSGGAITSDVFSYENRIFGLNNVNYPGGNGPWANIDGYIDDVKIYNRALSSEEIKYQYDVNKYKYE